MIAPRFPEELMRFALAEADLATRAVRPNPRVGCAIETAAGELITAHHQKIGGPHAERVAMAICKERGIDLKGARVAVTLEPCSHHGRTPPCADALIEARVAEVYAGIQDPFPSVSGRGIEKLRAAGIKVQVGVLAAEAEALNREWLFSHRHGRPFVTLKMATSWDGGWRSSSGSSKWITGGEARDRAQKLRQRVDAVVTGTSTVRDDDPALTARLPGGSLAGDQPKVLVLSRAERGFDLSAYQLARHPGGAEVVTLSESLEAFLKRCYARGFYDVMIESGPTLAGAFLEAGLVDEIWSFTETQLLGGEATLRFPRAFNEGKLPGLYFSARQVELLGSTCVFAVLGAAKAPPLQG